MFLNHVNTFWLKGESVHAACGFNAQVSAGQSKAPFWTLTDTQHRNLINPYKAPLGHKSQNEGINCYHTLRVVAWHRRVPPASLWRVRMWQTRHKQKKSCLATLSQKQRINSEAGESAWPPPWKLGATDPPHQQLIHWGSEEFLVRDYSWLQRRLFRAAKRAAALNGKKQTAFQQAEVQIVTYEADCDHWYYCFTLLRLLFADLMRSAVPLSCC